MGKQQEDFVAAFCDAWGDGSLEKKPDIEKILSMMSEDAEWQQWVPGGPVIRGRAALREELGAVHCAPASHPLETNSATTLVGRF